MDKVEWIKELVLAEQQMEEAGIVDFSSGFDQEALMNKETVEYLQSLKALFIETAAAFNQLKGSTLGLVKLYGISKTKADFMLFRNGMKLIFSMKCPGQIRIFASHLGPGFVTGQTPPAQPINDNEDVLSAQWGPFGDLNWSFQGQPIKLDYLVRHYLSRFIRESAK